MDRKKDAPIRIPLVPQMDGVPVYIDPLGSYTGVATDRMEQPVQDADDL